MSKLYHECVACGGHKPTAYIGDTGRVCVRCAATENGTDQPEEDKTTKAIDQLTDCTVFNR